MRFLPWDRDQAMSERDLNELDRLLGALLEAAPCKGGSCVGCMNCEFGENGCYGESCAIEDVQAAIWSTKENLII